MNPSAEHKKRDLLNRYLAGDITAVQEAELFRLAQEDPFLAEALEGIADFPAADHEAVAARLDQKLSDRTTAKKQRRILPIWLSRAAVLLGFFLSAGLIWYLMQTPVETQLADAPAVESEQASPTLDRADDVATTEEMIEPAAPIAEEVVEQAEAEPAVQKVQPTPPPPAVVEQSSRNESIPSQKDIATTAKKESAPPTDTQGEAPANFEAPPAAAADVAVADEEIILEAEPVTVEPARAPEADRAATMSRAKLKQSTVSTNADVEDAKAEARPIQGHVTDENGENLIGANVIVAGTSIGTVTDYDGKFAIDLPAGQNELVIAYTGYNEQTVEVPTELEGPLNIQLESGGVLLEEIVVVGYGVERKKDVVGQVGTVASARPINGYKNFRKYVKEQVRTSGESCKVKVSFTIINNRPTDIQVINADKVSPTCAAEAIRLLQAGPDWQKGDRERAKFKMNW